MAEQRYRVMNKCNYSIGITLANGQDIMIRPNSFQLLTADDIIYAESLCRKVKFFGKRMLVPYDNQGNEVTFDQLGGYMEHDPNPHLSNEEIEAALKQATKKVEAWLSGIEEPAELAAVIAVAKTMDLPASKLKLINAKVPNADILD